VTAEWAPIGYEYQTSYDYTDEHGRTAATPTPCSGQRAATALAGSTGPGTSIAGECAPTTSCLRPSEREWCSTCASTTYATRTLR